MNQYFTHEQVEGYSDSELDELNKDFHLLLEQTCTELNTDAYHSLRWHFIETRILNEQGVA